MNSYQNSPADKGSLVAMWNDLFCLQLTETSSFQMLNRNLQTAAVSQGTCLLGRQCEAGSQHKIVLVKTYQEHLAVKQVREHFLSCSSHMGCNQKPNISHLFHIHYPRKGN